MLNHRKLLWSSLGQFCIEVLITSDWKSWKTAPELTWQILHRVLNKFQIEIKEICSGAHMANFVLNSELIPIGNQRKLLWSSHG